ncbi:hypothetical protein NX059_010020 [Plenodomus lindquistii]|nr:hypothetical protein NX059_010020 [Plenodomus lindquistii]
MSLPYVKGLRSPITRVMLPRAVFIFLALAAFYHFGPLVLQRTTPHADVQHNIQNNAAQYVGQESKLTTAAPTHPKQGGLLVDASEPPRHPSSDHNKVAQSPTPGNFQSYGPQNCFPTFNATLQQHARTLLASCADSAPFPIHETYRVGFATASTGGALSPAFEAAMHSQMTHVTMHNSSMHMLCADIVPGMWNKIAYLIHLITLEQLKPKSERLDWILWIDRDALILDQCRPLSSFLPPNTEEYQDVDIIAVHDAYGLNAGLFMFRPNEWALEYFNSVAAYRHYKPDEDLLFAEQTAMMRLLEMTQDPDAMHKGIDDKPYGTHFARVPWYWFNAYPSEGGNTVPYTTNQYPDGYEYFRPHKGDFLAHFAGHNDREREMLEWADVVNKGGVVWEEQGKRRDISWDAKVYWRAWKSGSVTEAMRSGEPEKQKDEEHHDEERNDDEEVKDE